MSAEFAYLDTFLDIRARLLHSPLATHLYQSKIKIKILYCQVLLLLLFIDIINNNTPSALDAVIKFNSNQLFTTKSQQSPQGVCYFFRFFYCIIMDES